MGIEVNFEGKIALVTGASSGLGARFAKVLAQAGNSVNTVQTSIGKAVNSVASNAPTMSIPTPGQLVAQVRTAAGKV